MDCNTAIAGQIFGYFLSVPGDRMCSVRAVMWMVPRPAEEIYLTRDDVSDKQQTTPKFVQKEEEPKADESEHFLRGNQEQVSSLSRERMYVIYLRFKTMARRWERRSHYA